MKRICYTVAAILFISWVSLFFIFHIGYVAHTLVMLAAIFFLRGIILTAPKKIIRQAE
jgi:hypothetical protein